MKAYLSGIALLLILGLPVLAQEEPLEFDIELIVFRHLMPDDTEPPRQAEEPEKDGEDEEDGEEEPEIQLRRFTPLTTDQLRLNDISQRLLDSREWSPILHYGWRQPVLGREEAPAVAIAGNRRGAFATGNVRVTVERFLRLELDLKMDPGTSIVYTMEQARRLRSGQIHYFDHPQFGVIVLVSRTDQN